MSSNLPTIQKLIFEDLNKAYTYLSKPLTKVIYDEFGVLGLAVYEEEKKKFLELQEEIRLVTNLAEAELELLDEEAARQRQRELSESRAAVENKILNQSRKLLRQKYKQHELAKYNKIFKVDFGIDARSFFNHYHDFARQGQLGESLVTIKGRHLHYTGHVKVPMALPIDQNHHLTLIVQQ
jgi:ATP-dependent exoDNAse (exonuclease V) alpha subunit